MQASLKFKETQRNLAPLYERLHKKALDGEMRTGIWMMVQASAVLALARGCCVLHIASSIA